MDFFSLHAHFETCVMCDMKYSCVTRLIAMRHDIGMCVQ